MFAQTKMKIIELAIFLSILLLLSVEYSLARSDEDCEKESSLNYLSAKNTEAVIKDKILKGAVYPIDVNRKIGDVIFDILSKNPDHVSQIDAETGNQTTFREMKDRSIRLAEWMKKLGVGVNDTVVGCSHNHMDSYLPLVATFFIDAILSAWTTNIQETADTARRFMQQYAPKVIFVDEKRADIILEAAKLENLNVKLIVFGKHSSLQSLSEILNFPTEDDLKNFTLVNKKTPQEVAAILLTSGTTGFPKGIVYSGKSLLVIAMGYHSMYSDVGVFNGATHLWYNDYSRIAGLWFTLQAIVKKDIRIIATAPDENQLFQTVEKYKVNVVFIPVNLVHSVIESKPMHKYDVQSLQMIMISGLKFSREVLRRLQRELPDVFIQYIYGATEAGGPISYRTRKHKNFESVGFAVPNGEVRFVDLESNKNLGPYQQGEIYVKTLAMMTEYYKNPDLTKKTFDRAGWYRTGDLGFYNKNGEIFVVGRLKIIKQKNHTIVLPVIQYTLLTYPGVEQVAVVSIPHGSDGELPVAFVKKIPGSKITKNELMKLFADLEIYKEIDINIYFIDNIPLNASGKIVVRELEELAKNMVNTMKS